MTKRKNSVFQTTPVNRVKKNYFDLSHEVKMSGKFGLLYPMLLMDTLPGDVLSDQLTVFLRAAPMVAPIMHRVDVTTHFFFVPNRLLTDHWEEFITGGQDGDATPVLPFVTPAGLRAAGGAGTMVDGTLWDYLGLPIRPSAPTTESTEQISVLPFRAYQKVWNDYYRDPNFDDEKDLDLDLQGDVSATSYANGMFDRGRHMWNRDYFTSALATAQRGPDVLMPLTMNIDEAYLKGPGDTRVPVSVGSAIYYRDTGALSNLADDSILLAGDNTSVTINDFRRSVALQNWLEINARGGARYIEQIESHFNERVPDYRLQRAEYLGGGKQPIQISEVLATADSGSVPVGDMAGHGISVGKSNRFRYRCQEHGWVLGIITVTPISSYQQGIERMWSRADKFDFGWPELAHIGEQEIKSKELFYSFDADDDDENNETFGYIPRYAEYKFKNDRVAGDFRTTLDFWHLGRIFTSRPVLDADFTTMRENGGDEDSYRRVFADLSGTDYLWMQLFHNLNARRPLPYFGVPMLK